MLTPVRAALVTAALGLLFAFRLIDGSTSLLVQSWYQPILLAAAIGLIVLSGTVLIRSRSGPLTNTQRSRPNPAALLTGAILLLPLAVGFVVRPQPLGSSRLGNQNAADGSFALTASDAASPSQRNVYQWGHTFATTNPATLVGQPVDVSGFVYKTPQDTPGQFNVARFVVVCCIADAGGYWVPVQWPDSAALKPDSWVHIQGRVALSSDGSPVVQAARVEHVEAPTNPYIYP